MEEENVSLVSSCITKDQVQVATAKDPTLQLVTKYLEKGWPAKRMLNQELMPFFQLREELSMVDGIVFREDKVVVPDSLTLDLNQRGINHCISSVYYPQANGLVERFNRSLKNFIQVSVLEGRPLKEAVVDYLGVYRSTPHSTTGVSPAQLLHGRQPRTRLDIMGLPSKNFLQELATAMEKLRARVQSKQRSTKEYTDAKRSAKTPKFKEGDYVRVRKPTSGGKGELSYSRPLKIQKQLGPGTFRLEDGRSWNASKLVAVPEECVTERSKRLLHLLPVPGDQEQSARRTVSDNQGEYSVGENSEALATPWLKERRGRTDFAEDRRQENDGVPPVCKTFI
ncbi:uncharacterized protein LOC121836590 [Ixodes scapularis]|uniref:uncharacterized protein LOC121836590 n=1 Tax=Ixodes scapularis TaxID=6945 RepID=UPI001C3884A6|nr:uncharacterized protein LOC121836590 [Ixodes scapularis]